MILTGEQIEKSVASGEIVIDPFDKEQIGPNSYDFRLGDNCLIYKSTELDSAEDNEVVEIRIPDEGLLLVYIMEIVTTLFRAKLTQGLADFWVAANAIKARTKIVI